jgi:hypothetical protein
VLELWYRMWIDAPSLPEPPAWPAGLGPSEVQPTYLSA